MLFFAFASVFGFAVAHSSGATIPGDGDSSVSSPA